MKKLLAILGSLLIAHSAYADSVIVTSTNVISVTPTISTSIYAAGDEIGGKMTITGAARDNVRTGVISSVVITDKVKLGTDIDVVFFSADFTASADNAAFAPSNADLLNVVCVVNVTTDAAFSANGVSYATNVNCPFALSSGHNLYAAMVSRGTPTYSSTSDLTVKVGILQD